MSSLAPAAPTRAGVLSQITWASGSFATGALFNGMALFALFFMTNFLGISPAVAGTIILVTRIYDGVIDPLIGALSDRTTHRWGPRRIYLLIGGLALGLSFALFFNLVGWGLATQGATSALLVVLVLMIYSTAYSIFTIPYLAMPPEFEPDYDGRTRLMSFRVFFQLAGVTAGSVGAPALVALAGGERAGYELMGLVLGIAAMALCLLVFVGAAWLPKARPAVRSTPLNAAALLVSPFTDAWRVMEYKPFRLLTFVKLCQLGVLATVLASTPYFFAFVLKMDQGLIAQYFGVFSVAGILSLPIYRMIVRRFGKRETYLVLLVVYGLGIASWYLWHPDEAPMWFYIRALLIGSFSTGTLLCALAMLPDAMEYDRLRSGESREGTISGVWTFTENFAGALGPFIVGLMLQANGLIVSQDPTTVQPPEVLEAVIWCTSLIPALFCFLAIPLLLRYRLDGEMLADMRAKAAV